MADETAQTRSEYLAAKLRDRRDVRDSHKRNQLRNEVQSFIEGVPGIKLVRFIEPGDEDMPSPSHFWRRIIPYWAIPSSCITEDRSEAEIREWVVSSLILSGIHSRAYLSLGQPTDVWFEIDLEPGSDWLVALWTEFKNDSRDML